MSASQRRYDLDNLRTFLTGLVIVHHTSNCYGGPGNGPFTSLLTATAHPAARLPLMVFNAVNQSFFMAVFFWISGYVSSQALARIDSDPARSRWSFVRSKLLRLGLPSVVYTLVLEPATIVLGMRKADAATARGLLRVYFANLDRIRGPVWYTANLLIFDVAAAALARLRHASKVAGKASQSRVSGATDVSLPTWHQLAVRYGWIGVLVANFLIRLWYPIGVTIRPSGLQIGFAAQYIFAYTMGFVSPGVVPLLMGPFPSLTGSAASPGAPNSISKTVLISLLLNPLPLLPHAFSLRPADMTNIAATGVLGGWNLSALLWSFWTEISFVLIGPAVMARFYHERRQPSTSSWVRPKDAYGAYLAHMLASGIVEKAVDWALLRDGQAPVILSSNGVWRALGPLAMTFSVGLVNVFASFAMAKVVLDSFPTLRRIS